MSLSANAELPVHGRHQHHLSLGPSRAFTTLYQHEYKGLGSPRPAPDHDKPWQGRAGTVLPHVGTGQAAGLGSHHTQPTFSGCSQHQPSSCLGQEIFWGLLVKPSEGSRTSLCWTSPSTGLTPQSPHPRLTTSLSQSETILPPKDVVLLIPCPGCMFLLAPLCQHNSWCSCQAVGSVWWLIFQPDYQADLPHHVVPQLPAWHCGVAGMHSQE